MPTLWDLHAVVLHHHRLFFDAAAQVVREWRDPQSEQIGALLGLIGNLLWARSEYATANRQDEETVALGGAVLGSVGPQLVPGAAGAQAAAAALLGEQERQLVDNMDSVLDALQQELTAARAGATPGALDRWVWERLFPGTPYGLGRLQLEDALRARLAAAVG